MRTIAVVSRKGGSGKTTLAVQLAIGLWLRGRSTLVADTDPQQSSVEVLRARKGEGPEVVPSAGSKLFALQVASVRAGVDALILDTPAVVEEEAAQAIVLADLTIMVLRPTFLDLAAAVHTSRLIRQLRKPGLLVLNQASPARGDIESPAVKRAMEALQLLRLPVAPVALRSRAIYQTAMELGRSPEESDPQGAAGRETTELFNFLDRFIFGDSGTAQSRAS